MEKSEVTITLDAERLDALEYYLHKERSSVQKRMEEALRQLYEQTVPEPVREFLDSKAQSTASRSKSRPQAAKAPAAPKQTERMEEDHHEQQRDLHLGG